MQSKSIWTILIGSLFVLIGALILFDNLGMLSFKVIWKTYWPLILILFGILIVVKRYSVHNYFSAGGDFNKRNAEEKEYSYESDQKEYRATSAEFDQSNVFGNIDYSNSSKEYPGGNISNIFGDIFVDLSEIDFSEGKKNVNISGVFGSLRVRLPKNIPVKFSGSTIAGTIKFLDEKKDGLLINMNSQTTDYETADKKLNIRASLIFGDMNLK